MPISGGATTVTVPYTTIGGNNMSGGIQPYGIGSGGGTIVTAQMFFTSNGLTGRGTWGYLFGQGGTYPPSGYSLAQLSNVLPNKNWDEVLTPAEMDTMYDALGWDLGMVNGWLADYVQRVMGLKDTSPEQHQQFVNYFQANGDGAGGAACLIM